MLKVLRDIEVQPESTPVYVQNYAIDFTRLLYMQYQEVDHCIRHADLKAQVVLGINAILVAAVTNNITIQPTTMPIWMGLPLTQVRTVLHVLILVCLLLSIFFALHTITPRYKPSQTPNKLYFFGDIIQLEEMDFVQRYLNMSLDEVKTEIIAQIHAKSFIVYAKFQAIRRSMIFLGAAILVWGLQHFLFL